MGGEEERERKINKEKKGEKNILKKKLFFLIFYKFATTVGCRL